MIIKVYLVYLSVKHITAQYDPYSYNSYNAYTYQEPTYNQWSVQQTRNIEQTEDYTNPEYVTCTCQTCYNPKPCCKEFCKSCPPAFNYNQLKYVFMPFSYSFDYLKLNEETTEKPTIHVSTSPTTKQTTSPITTTTATTITTETTVSFEEILKQLRKIAELKIVNDRDEEDIHLYRNPLDDKGSDKIMLTSMRRTKPNWIAKYGIVPISNGFAEKLMLQLRNMKVLHPGNNNIRSVNR